MKRRIFFAGGGTAGHVEPALAVADEIVKLPGQWECIFLGTESGIESKLVPERGYQLQTIPKVSLPRKISVASLLFPIKFIHAIRQTRRTIAQADAVIGFGGYISAAAYLAARTKSIPILVHEANAKPGWANRLGRRFADVVAVNFPKVKLIWPESILTGIPIRPGIAELAVSGDMKRNERAIRLGLDSNRPILAVFGGSQGSSRINAAISEYLHNPSVTGVQIIHAIGPNNPLPEARSDYLPMPYFEDMPTIYALADYLITRSGAVTCAELLTVGKFAILVPLPHGNGEQMENASELVDSGNAVLVSDEEFDGNWLRQNLPRILGTKHNQLSTTRRNINAATEIARLTSELLQNRGEKTNDK
jgi:UDP-N-acetylglucosamine--N-acetylmuramyl-(pentapeptide) pyrophosphoryl-undecaprenol N-acetylglucosamine transferase